MADDPEAPGSSDGPSKTAVGGIPDLRHIPRGRRGPDRGSRPLQARRAAVRQRTPGNLGGGGPTGGPEILHSHGGLRAEFQYFRGGCPHPAGNDETGPRNRRATLFSDRRRKAGAVPGMDQAIPPSAPQGAGAADPVKIHAPRRPERGHPLVRLTSGEGLRGPIFRAPIPPGGGPLISRDRRRVGKAKAIRVRQEGGCAKAQPPLSAPGPRNQSPQFLALSSPTFRRFPQNPSTGRAGPSKTLRNGRATPSAREGVPTEGGTVFPAPLFSPQPAPPPPICAGAWIRPCGSWGNGRRSW